MPVDVVKYEYLVNLIYTGTLYFLQHVAEVIDHEICVEISRRVTDFGLDAVATTTSPATFFAS
jgi:hypothetical protein